MELKTKSLTKQYDKGKTQDSIRMRGSVSQISSVARLLEKL